MVTIIENGKPKKIAEVPDKLGRLCDEYINECVGRHSFGRLHDMEADIFRNFMRYLYGDDIDRWLQEKEIDKEIQETNRIKTIWKN